LISAHHARYLPGLAVGLSSITPLAPQPAGADASATSRHAFGAIATVLPPTTARLALLLIHEFQHAKLGGLMDLVPLHDDSDNRLYPAPWRPDPRPLGALLQGAYAHLGVADFWRLHRFSAGSAAAAQSAQEHFSRWRAHTASVVDVLLRSSALTSDGRRFVTAMATTVESW
jgi:uncharacterized protein